MATQVQFRGGTTSEHSSFNGVAKEVTVDTTKQTLVVQDGSTNGGFPLLREKNPTGQKVYFGNSNQLEIYHDTDAYIKNNAGDLILRDDVIKLKAFTTTDTYLEATNGGGVVLRWDNSPKFETTSSGVEVSNAADNKVDLKFHYSTNSGYSIIQMDNANNLILDCDPTQAGSDSFIELRTDGSTKLKTYADGIKCFNHCRVEGDSGEGATLALYADQASQGDDQFLITSTGSALKILGQYDSGWHRYLQVDPNGGVNLYYDQKDDASPAAKLVTTSQGINLEGNGTDHHILDLHNSGSGKGSQIKFRNDHEGGAYIGLTGDTTGDLRVYTEKTFKVVHGSDTAITSTADGAVQLYNDNVLHFTTHSLGIKVLGATSGTAQIDIQPDQGADNADKWKVGAEDDGHFFISNKDSGAWDKSIASNRSGNTELYYDGGSATLATTASGVDIAGSTVKIDGGTGDPYIYLKRSGAGDSAVNIGGFIFQNSSNNLANIHCTSVDANDGKLYFQTMKAGTLTTALTLDNLSNATFAGKATVTPDVPGGEVGFVVNYSNPSGETTYLGLRTNSVDYVFAHYDGSGLTSSIDFDGKTYLGGNLLIGRAAVGNTGNGHSIRAADSAIFSRDAAGETMTVARNADAGHLIRFYQNGTHRTEIEMAANGTVSYNTSSDYRLKENEVAISDGITRLKQLKPYRFNFKETPSETVDGFFAHEVSPAVPEAISGTKDATENVLYVEGDEIPEGKSVGDVKETIPNHQGIDQSKLVPLLTAALQEAITKIETLETKVAALESS